MPSKKKSIGERATSPVEELEEVDPADEQPESESVQKKKKKKSRGDVTEEAEATAPKKKQKKKKQADPEPVSEAEEEEEEADGDAETTEIDWAVVDNWVKEFRSANRRLPNAAELGEAAGLNDALAKKVQKKVKAKADALVNKKKAKKIRGYAQLAGEVGYGFTAEVDKDGEALERIGRVDAGVDMLRPLLSMSDALRLATYIPSTPDAVTIGQREFNDKLELQTTTCPQSVAREIIANADPMLRHIITAATKAQIAQGGTKINPSTVAAVIKGMVEHTAFPSMLTPAGLVKFSMDEAPPTRKEFDQGDKGLEKFKKALGAFNDKVAYADRGIAAVEQDGDNSKVKNRIKVNTENAKVNGKAYAAKMKEMEDAKAAKKKPVAA